MSIGDVQRIPGPNYCFVSYFPWPRLNYISVDATASHRGISTVVIMGFNRRVCLQISLTSTIKYSMLVSFPLLLLLGWCVSESMQIKRLNVPMMRNQSFRKRRFTFCPSRQPRKSRMHFGFASLGRDHDLHTVAEAWPCSKRKRPGNHCSPGWLGLFWQLGAQIWSVYLGADMVSALASLRDGWGFIFFRLGYHSTVKKNCQ